tara:strand:+ start:269 stop:1819 length:1551 start_codon:yes stop_codon:yes gene_type:complete
MSETQYCSICTEKFTQERRKKTSCSGCDLKCCRECVRKYLTGETMIDDPHCMGCRLGWSQSVVYDAVGKTFVGKDIVKHRKKILLERSRANIPEVQEYALARRDIPRLQEQYDKKRTDFEKELVIKRREWQMAHREELAEIHRLRRIVNPNDNQVRENRAQFIHKCSLENCEGFLSSAWKCGVCDTYTCIDCGKNKGINVSGVGFTHECVAEDVSSFSLIKSQCKPCPNCATQIYKIEGCDQMWCTQCKTPFSWRTGQRIDGGAIHNPHYFEWARLQGGGEMHRQPGDVVCGGVVEIFDMDRILNSLFPNYYRSERGYRTQHEGEPIYDYFSWLIMRRNHYANYEMLALRPTIEQMDRVDKDMLSDFIVGNLDEETFSAKLIQIDKKRRFNAELYSIMETFTVVVNEHLHKIVDSTSSDMKACVYEVMLELAEFSLYLENNLEKLLSTYGYKSKTFIEDVKQNTRMITWIFTTVTTRAPYNKPRTWPTDRAWPPDNLPALPYNWEPSRSMRRNLRY